MKPIYMTADEILAKLDATTKELNKCWEIIQDENVVTKIEAPLRTADCRDLYRKVVELAKKRVAYKLDSIMLNMGYKNREELFAESPQPVIYQLSELRAREVQLKRLKTIDPKAKQYRGGKLKETEQITRGFVENEVRKIRMEANKLDDILCKFNASAKFDVSGKYSFQK